MVKTKIREYVKVAEASEILGVSQGTVRAWAESGKIPMHKNPANGYRLFRKDDLEKFLKTVARPVSSQKKLKG
jgi:excisionase family DNA binding protein